MKVAGLLDLPTGLIAGDQGGRSAADESWWAKALMSPDGSDRTAGGNRRPGQIGPGVVGVFCVLLAPGAARAAPAGSGA